MIKDLIQNILRVKGYQFIKVAKIHELQNIIINCQNELQTSKDEYEKKQKQSKHNKEDYLISHPLTNGLPKIKYSFIAKKNLKKKMFFSLNVCLKHTIKPF
ncbi:MAG: hypothetical protein GYA62_06215 [Bacteroidales bacterium]|nr:hypothetical protein [Bacteroidales bacterium]